MAESERVRNEVIYKKEITTDEPNAHAELIMKIEGVSDEKTEGLRKKFLALYEDMEEVVRKETLGREGVTWNRYRHNAFMKPWLC